MQVIDNVLENLDKFGYILQGIAYSPKTRTGVVHAKTNNVIVGTNNVEHVVWWFDQNGATYSGSYTLESVARKTFIFRVSESF